MRVDVSLDRLLNSRQPLRGKPDLFRFDDWIDAAARGPVSRTKTGATYQSFFMNPSYWALSYCSGSSAASASGVSLFGHHWPRFLLPCHPRRPRPSVRCSRFVSNAARRSPRRGTRQISASAMGEEPMRSDPLAASVRTRCAHRQPNVPPHLVPHDGHRRQPIPCLSNS